MKPFFSLIIPIYNVEQYIEECLNSILKQTFTEWEAICVIDGSPDQSASICKRYAESDSRFKVFEQSNQGAAAARNHGLLEAQGDYIHFVDPDDRLPNEQVYENMHRIIMEHDCDVLVGRSDYYQDTFDQFTENGIGYDLVCEDYNSLSLILENKYFFALTSGVNKLYRKEILIGRKILWPLNVINEDDRWLPKVMNASRKIVFTTEMLYDVRRRTGSITSSKGNERLSRRGLGYMQTALEDLELISAGHISDMALKNGIEYYVQLYFTGFKMHKDNGGSEPGYKDLVRYLKNSGNSKMRAVYFLSLIMGKGFAFSVMKRRYKVE